MKTSFDEDTGRQRYFALLEEAVAKMTDPNTGKIKAHLVEMVPCPACGCEKDFIACFSKQGFNIVRCPSCDLVFVNPQLKDESIHELYADEDTFYASWSEVLKNKKNQSWQIPYFEEALLLLRQATSCQRLLDVGCSIGLFLSIVKKAGIKGMGLELERSSFTYAQSQGLDVQRKTLEEASFPDNYFDAITLFGVLEHVKQPRALLQEIYRCLRPGGAVLAIVPSANSLAAMTLHARARMFNGRNHLSYFSPKTLRALFTAAGFQTHLQDTCLTGLDSLLNHYQFRDPDGPFSDEYLPPKVRDKLATPNGREEIERFIKTWDMGLRARIIAIK